MSQLPIFVNLEGRRVILLGEGDSADAKRRLIERAGGICVGEDDQQANIAFIALEDESEAIEAAHRLRAKGLLTNVVDRPALCDFTTPAMVDRAPLLIAIGTGGASAGLAKAVRQRLERLLPPDLGGLAQALFASRVALKRRYPDAADRRRAIDAALDEGGPLDPMTPNAATMVVEWLKDPASTGDGRLEVFELSSDNPDDLTLGQARLLGQVDTLYHDEDVPAAVLDRARADAVRICAPPPASPEAGLSLYLKLQKSPKA
jgi:uroporphyrin-III C-methyltransferase / precorrin-2 dehydrogenase / sirohydrochlorin ferrochelatase